MCLKKIIFFLCALISLGDFSAYSWTIHKGPYHFDIGPEVYHVKRKRRGSEQTGWLYGSCASIGRMRPHAIYWDVHGYYVCGDSIKGSSARGTRLNSELEEYDIEGQIGYLWQTRCLPMFSIIPFLGYGYFRGENAFVSPSPISCTFDNKLEYFSTGFLSKFKVRPFFFVGFNAFFKFILEGKSTIKDDDPNIDTVRLTIGEKTQYEFQLPITYVRCLWGKMLHAKLVPFYRFRHYGRHEGFPFDFYDTKFHIWGADLFFGIDF